jgi:hypothetical protein
MLPCEARLKRRKEEEAARLSRTQEDNEWEMPRPISLLMDVFSRKKAAPPKRPRQILEENNSG